MPEWKINETPYANPYLQYAADGMLHPDSQLWQLWVTFDGQNLNWVAAYSNQSGIEMAVKELRDAIEVGESFSIQKALAILNKLYDEKEAEPQPMPPNVEDTIRRNMVSK